MEDIDTDAAMGVLNSMFLEGNQDNQSHSYAWAGAPIRRGDSLVKHPLKDRDEVYPENYRSWSKNQPVIGIAVYDQLRVGSSVTYVPCKYRRADFPNGSKRKRKNRNPKR